MLKNRIAGGLLVLTCCIAAVVFYRQAHHVVEKSPFAAQDQAPVFDKKAFIRENQQRSVVLIRLAVESLQKKQAGLSIQQLMEAVRIFPPNTEAYSLLVKIFLMTGQEQKMYEALEAAGRSYPSFDKIIGIIDDADLSRIPLPSDGDVFIAPFKGYKKMAMSFLFDDGEASVYSGILPLFDKYGFKATIPVIAGQVAARSGDPFRGSWQQWKDAARRGFEIANHSMNHHDSTTLKDQDLKLEIDDAKDMIEKNAATQVRSFVFPMDRYSDKVQQYVLRSHAAVRKPDFLRSVYARSLVIVYGGPNFSLLTGNRLMDIGMARHLWVVSESHGLDQRGMEHYKPVSAGFLDQHLAYIHSHAKDIWVDTFDSVFEYLLLRRLTQAARKDTSDHETMVALHDLSAGKAVRQALTLVLKVKQVDPGRVSAISSKGASFKAWACGEGLVCVDIDVFDVPVHVAWDGKN